MDIHEVKDAVEELGRTWTAFQEENNRKSGRNEELLAEMNGRMDRLEAAMGRAARASAEAGEPPDHGPEAKAYFDYLRFGTRDATACRTGPRRRRASLGLCGRSGANAANSTERWWTPRSARSTLTCAWEPGCTSRAQVRALCGHVWATNTSRLRS